VKTQGTGSISGDLFEEEEKKGSEMHISNELTEPTQKVEKSYPEVHYDKLIYRSII